MNAVADSDTETRARLREGIQCSQKLLALYDQNDRLQYANRAFSLAFPHSDLSVDFSTIIRANHAVGAGVNIGTHSIDSYLRNACARRRSQAHCAYSAELMDGRHLWVTETCLSDNWLLTEAVDITALKQTETSLRAARDIALEASQTDYLTKLPNRRYGFELLNQALRGAQSREQALSIALIDLDFFKNINDRYGHGAGDSALRQFAENCYANLRAIDTIARIGGEEFLIVFPGATAERALDILNRLHHKPIQVSLESGAIEFSFTFSAGIAQASAADSRHSLLARADQAVYAAKARGRNAIQVASPPRG